MLRLLTATPLPGQPMIDVRHEAFPQGACRIWLPEGIATARGFASIYPHSVTWQRDGNRLRHRGSVEQVYGGGNFPEAEPGVLECAGVRMAKEPPVEWEVDCAIGENRVDFTLTVRNPNPEPLSAVAGAVCVKFLDAAWWSDETTHLVTTKGSRSIARLGRGAGMGNGFQAWLVEGEDYENRFYREFWGFNAERVVKPVWVSEGPGFSVVVGCDAAYFIHSNPGNPCTDLAMKTGDLGPRESGSCSGFVEYRAGELDPGWYNGVHHE